MTTAIPEQSRAAIVRPGDTLVIAMNSRLGVEMLASIERGVKEAMPGLAEVVVISDAAGLVVYRPDGAPA